MPETRQFLVTVGATYENDLPALDATYVRDSMVNAVSEWGCAIHIRSVMPYDPANMERLGKIQSIKRVRELITGCSLRDAKFLVDHASETGQSRWANVTVTRHVGIGTETFTVSTDD